MTLRSQTVAALVVLLAALGIVFWAVGDAGVSTHVFTPDNTATPVPPTPTPAPAAADKWTPDDTKEGAWTYAVDPAVSATISQEVISWEDAASRLGVTPPTGSDPLPGLVTLSEFRALFEESRAAAERSGVESPFSLDGPAVELFGKTPVALARLIIQPNANPNFPDGVDVGFGLIDLSDQQVNFIQYTLMGAANDTAYADFKDWLAVKADELAAKPAPDATPGADATPEAETPAVSTPEAETPAAATPVAEAPVEGAKWVELGPGQFRHATNSNAVFYYTVIPAATMSTQLGLEAPAPDTSVPLITYLDAIYADFKQQVDELQITLAPDAVEGPGLETVGGVQIAVFRITVAAQTPPSGQAINGREIAMILIDLGQGDIQTIQMRYQGDPDPTVYADFRAWVADNIEALSTPPEPTPEAEAPAGTPSDQTPAAVTATPAAPGSGE